MEVPSMHCIQERKKKKEKEKKRSHMHIKDPVVLH